MALKPTATSFISNFRAARIGLLVLVPVLLFAADFRVHYFGPDGLLQAPAYSPADGRDRNLFDLHQDARIGWTLKPDLETRFKGASFTTNRHGFRTSDYEVAKTRDVIRIAVLGRSVTMGAGVADDEVYPARLQAMLDEQHPGRFEVLNLAVGGYHFPQMAAIYEEYVAALEPDLLLVPMTPALSIGMVSEYPHPWPQRVWGDLRPILAHSFVYEALRQALGDWIRANLASDWRQRVRRNRAGLPRSVSVRGLLEHFVRRRQQEDVPVVVVMLKVNWALSEGHQRSIVQQNRQWLNAYSNAALIDTTTALKGRVGGSDYIYYGDDHPNPKVHDLYAQLIYASLPPLLRRFDLH